MSEQPNEGKLYVALGAYLADLKAQGARDVPTVRDLAQTIGVHEVTLHNIVRGRNKQLTLHTALRVLDEMNRRGFPMTVENFLHYERPLDLEANA